MSKRGDDRRSPDESDNIRNHPDAPEAARSTTRRTILGSGTAALLGADLLARSTRTAAVPDYLLRNRPVALSLIRGRLVILPALGKRLEWR